MKQARGGKLLIPAVEAAPMLGISRWTLNRRIEAKEIKAVKVGPRRFIPQSEIDRIISGQTGQIEPSKLASCQQTFSDGAGRSTELQSTENGGGMDYERQCRFIESQTDFPAILAECSGIFAGPNAEPLERAVARAEWKVRHRAA